jgi:DNA-binding transcriptional MerR regulator
VEPTVQELPRKQFYKASEVCRYTDTQPYVLRFWEREFPQLNPRTTSGGRRVYRRSDIALVQRIKELLHDEACSLDVARKRLAEEAPRGTSPKPRKKTKAAEEEPPAAPGPRTTVRSRPRSALSAPRKRREEPPSPTAVEIETVPRQRYDDAVEEVRQLRLDLKKAGEAVRRAERAHDEARAEADRDRERAEKAIEHMERLLEFLS